MVSAQPARNLRNSRHLFIFVGITLLLGNYSHVLGQYGSVTPGSGIVIFGRVSLPDGKPASRVRVVIEGPQGITRDVLTDDQGNYEIRGMTSGKYKAKASNPNAPDQYSDPAESDTTRAFSNRLQIDIYLRLPATVGKNNLNPGTVSANEPAQNIPKPARKAYEQGQKLQKENKADLAITQFTQAIEIFPEYFQAFTERANLRMEQNKLTEAETDFAKALTLNGKYPPALRGIGYCQIQQKKFGDALGNLEKAYSLEPNIPMTLLLLGYANLSLSRYEEAKLCLQEALKMGPETTARAHVYLAEIFVHEQKFKEAAEEVGQYLKLKPDAADAVHLKELESQWRAQSKASVKRP